jgi:hypothetical protein
MLVPVLSHICPVHTFRPFLKDKMCIVLATTPDQGRVDGTAARYRLSGPGFDSRWGEGQGIFFSSKPVHSGPAGHPLPFNGYRVSFTGGEEAVLCGVALTTHPHLAPRLRQKQGYTCTTPVCRIARYNENFAFTNHAEVSQAFPTAGFPAIFVHAFLISSVSLAHLDPSQRNTLPISGVYILNYNTSVVLSHVKHGLSH